MSVTHALCYLIVVLQSNSENCDYLKYVWNVYCVITNHERDLQPQKP